MFKILNPRKVYRGLRDATRLAVRANNCSNIFLPTPPIVPKNIGALAMLFKARKKPNMIDSCEANRETGLSQAFHLKGYFWRGNIVTATW